MRSLMAFAAFFASATAAPAAAQTDPWGVLREIGEREWTTQGEERNRVTRHTWVEAGRVLIAKHGFASRLALGDDQFGDTFQRFVYNPATRSIDVTYTYEDGRPTLRSTIRILEDGTAVETFTTADGVSRRNTYRYPRASFSTVAREEQRNGVWVGLGTSQRTGATAQEIADARAAQARARALADAEINARNAELAALREQDRAAEDAAAASSGNSEPMGAVFLRELQGMVRQAEQETERTGRELDARIRAGLSGSGQRAAEARAEANRIAAENARIDAARAASASAPSPQTGTGGGQQEARRLLTWCRHVGGSGRGGDTLYVSGVGMASLERQQSGALSQEFIEAIRAMGGSPQGSQAICGQLSTQAEVDANRQSVRRMEADDSARRWVDVSWSPN